MLDSTLDVMTSKGQMLPFKETYGTRQASNKIEEFFKVENNQVRRESQGNNMLVLRKSDDTYLGKVSYYDIENYFSIKGSQLKDGVVLDKNINVLDLPVDPIKITDYSSYYWLADDLPPCRIHLNSPKFSIVTDLLGRPFITLKDDLTGRELELQNGMALYFTGDIDSNYKTLTGANNIVTEDLVIFYVYGVGKSIGLFAKTNLETRSPASGLEKRPWDKYGDVIDYSATSWDNREWDGSEMAVNIVEYVVQEKYTTDTNHWQVLDKWHHISAIRKVAKFLNLTVDDIVDIADKAIRPIISFNKDVRLYNWPYGNITEINSILPGVKSMWENTTNPKDQFGYTLKDGDGVVFELTSGVWQVNNVSSMATFTLVNLTVNEGDGGIIVSPGVSEYFQVIYKNSKWQLAQNKTTANQTPLFEFYTSNGVSVSSLNNTDFKGGIILGFQSGATYDKVLGRYINIDTIETENNIIQVTPNQITFATEVDLTFSYADSATNDQLTITGPYGYQSVNKIIPFYKKRTGLDFTKQIQDLLYTTTEDSEWSGEIIPVSSGFTTIHIYYDEVEEYKFYFDVEGYGLIRFSGKSGDDSIESVLPLISGGIMKIVCHDLPYPITFYKTGLLYNITKKQAIPGEYIVNNGISNGIIELNLNSNELSTEDTKLLWEFNGIYKTAFVKSLYNWNFIQGVFTKDKTNPLYNNFDYTLNDVILDDGSLGYYKQLTASTDLTERVQTGDKICVGSIIQNPESRTAPASLVVNPLNESLSNINYYSLYQNATALKSNSTDIRKFFDKEDPTSTVFMGGGTILKHSDPLTKTAIMATNLPYDFGDLLIKQGKHYDIFLSKLKTELENIINSTDYTLLTSLEVLDLALNKIYVISATDDLFWSHSNMMGWGISADNYHEENVIITLQPILLEDNRFSNISHRTGKESILHITYDDKLLLRDYDYWFNSVNDEYTEIEFRSFYIDKSVNIKQWYTTFRSMIPASLPKIGLSPVYQPSIYLDSVVNNYFIRRHDGTRYYLKDGLNADREPLNLVEHYLYEYEKAVWSSIAYDVENNNQREILEGQPGYFRNTSNSWDKSRQTINNEVRSWMIENNIFIMENTDYDSINGFTLKYQLGTGDGDSLTGSYKALYTYMYDTERPHTHPWEMLGFTLKPTWWDTHYSWLESESLSISVVPDNVTWNVGLNSSIITSTSSNVINKRQALKRALRVGKISNPTEADVINPAFARNIDINNNDPDTLEDFPVDNLGNLISPMDFDALLLENSIYLSLSIFEENTNWEAGDIGPYEQVFLNTQRGVAAQARVRFLLAPAQYVNLNWLPGQTITNVWGNKLDRTTNFWQQGSIEHDYHRETVNGVLVYTGGIESLYSEFCVLNNKDYVTEVIDMFDNIVVNKEFLLNGFTNKDNLRIQSTSMSTQKNILFVPEENYQVRTVKHYPEREIFYSGMKIIFDGTNYSLNGFASEYGYFPYYVPKEGSTTTPVIVGNVTVKEKNSYSNEIAFVQYGKLFSNRQEIYDILIGYGKYLESLGIVYDEPEAGDIRDWQLSAKQFIFWSTDTLAPGNFIDLNPCADFIKITGQYGQLENLEGTNENIGQCVDEFNKPLFSKDLLVSRDVTSILIKTKKDGTGIYGIKLVFVNYESVVHLDSTSIFRDVYFSPSQNTTKRSFITGGKKSINWTGAYYVPGYVFDGTSLIPNFDSMAEVGHTLLDIESTILDTEILNASRAQFGLNRNIELRQLFLDQGNEVLFKNAITFNKGTIQVFDSLNPLTHQDSSKTTAYEEYMVRLGEFGNTENIEYYEFEMLSSDVLVDSQLIKFTPRSGSDSNVLYVTDNSNRWVYKPYGKLLDFTNKDSHGKLKRGGPVITGDTDLEVNSLDDLSNLYNDFIDLWTISEYSASASYKIAERVRYDGYLFISNETILPGTWASNSNKFTLIPNEPYLPNIFVNNYNKPNPGLPKSGYTPGTWQVLQTVDNNLAIKEVCTGLTDVSKARISTGTTNHNLVVGDYVCIVNAAFDGSSANGIWKVTGVEKSTDGTEYFFYINTRILKTIYAGKVFTFMPVRFKNQLDFEAATQDAGSLSVTPSSVTWNITPTYSTPIITSNSNNNSVINMTRYNWQQKYEDEFPPTPSGYDLRYPIAIVDNGLNDNVPVTFNYGNYKVYQFKNDSWDEVKVETQPLKLDDIEHLIVYDYATNKTVIKLELFSPQDLVIPQVFKDDIDIISRVDPAKYNRTTDAFKSIYTSLGWYEEYVGRRWWNTNSTQFNDYITASDQVKAEYWGTTTKNKPEIYEWTKSPVHPSKWEKLVTSKTVVFGQLASGQAYEDTTLGNNNYYWVEEEDYVNGKTYTVYYFWVKNKKTIAQESKYVRTYTVEQLSKVILNPSAAGLAWWSPIGSDTIIVKGIKPYLNSSSTVVQIKKKTKGEEKNQQWVFVSEDNTVETVPEWLHVRLRDSISGHLFYKKTEMFTDYSTTTLYDKTDIVKYNNKFYLCVIDMLATVGGLWDASEWGNIWDDDSIQPMEFNINNWHQLTSITEIDPKSVAWDTLKWGKIWDADSIQQIQFYIEKNVPDIANLHRYNRLGNSIRPYVQTWFNDLYEARRTFIKKLNNLLLHVDISEIANWENSILTNTAYMVADHEIDMTAYWSTSDYRSEDYKSTKAIGKIINNISKLYNETYTIGEYIRINDVTNPKQYAIYEKTATGGFNVVFRKNSAIQFIEKFDIYGWDSSSWDDTSVVWDYDVNSAFNGITDAIRTDIFVGKYMKYYSSIMCSMFRYVLSEQINVDWLAKSSTIEPVNLIAQTLSNNDYVKRDEIGTLTDFFSSVKAYRDKIRGGTINKISIDTLNVAIAENIVTVDITDANYIATKGTEIVLPIKITVDAPWN
jgi:hypothetical protein